MATNVYHQLGGRTLWDWHTVVIENKGDSKFVTLTSRLHVRRELPVPFQFSDKFTDQQILRDHQLVTFAINHYGVSMFATGGH